MNANKNYKADIEFVYDWSESPRNIFDVGCGTANYWKYFPERCYIRGIERSIDMIVESGRPKEILLGNVQDKTIMKAHNPDFDLCTALFDVINYIPQHQWWNRLPLKPGGYFIFDCYDKKKVDLDGFNKTIRKNGDVERIIVPGRYDGKKVQLYVVLFREGHFLEINIHELYIFSNKEIERFASRGFEIVEKKETNTWHTWWKLRKK